MLKLLKDHWLNRRIEHARAVRVTFTGGLGAQVLSTAIYLHFVDRGFQTLADLSYFENPHTIATPGRKGQLSHWQWEMDGYGFSRANLNTHLPQGMSLPTLHDGALKLSMALRALASTSVRARFDVSASDQYSALYRDTELLGQRYVCIHVRRGDYLNVASHLINSNTIDNLACKFYNLVDRVLILSDSPVDLDEFTRVRSTFQGRVHIIDSNPDPVLAHSLMRNASILVCSNSQFSLSAGLLSDGLKIIPKIWFAEADEHLNRIVDSISDFAVVR